jgi:hypothetical protein
MRLGSLCFALVTIATPACEGAVTGGTGGDAEAMSMRSLIVVERMVDPYAAPRAQASARFLRVSASVSSDDGLRAIGAALDLPTKGTCAPLGSSPADVSSDEPAPVVELVDVGPVVLDAEGVETHLAARQVPDVTDVISGIVYVRAGDLTTFPASARYVVHAQGQGGVHAFDVVASAPPDPIDVRVAGESAAGTTLSVSGPVDVSWSPGGAFDTIYVDVQPAGVRCTLGDGQGAPDADAGRSTLPASLLGAEGTLTVHRLHRETTRGGSVESDVRFDFARSLSYARR